MQREAKLMRNQRPTRNNPMNRQFVAGGVISNFTGVPVKTEPATPTTPTTPNTPANNIQVSINDVPTQSSPEQMSEPQLAQELTAKLDASIKTDDQPDSEHSPNGSLKRRFIRPQLSKKVKRLRRNRRLRKILMPKNALMSLHELLGAGLSEFSISPEERGFVATIFVNNTQYDGRGISKIAAKNSASEKALRDIIIQRMHQAPRSNVIKAINDPQQQSHSDDLFHDDVDMATDNIEATDDETEVPMMHLASFALHKLFSEWQADGFEIPDFKAVVLPTAAPIESMLVDKPPKQPSVPTNRTQVPDDAASMHPTTLLCIMRPATKYVDLGSEGQPPKVTHRVGTEVDGEHFIGVAKSKKLARKNAAIDACNRFFGTAFAKDEN